MAITSENTRNIEKAVSKVRKNWEIKPDTKEICKKPLIWNLKLIHFFWKPRHTVWALYWFCKYEFHENPQLLGLGFPIEHDNLPIEGLPIKYELLDNWNIPTRDINYLYMGPLYSNHLSKVIVPTYSPIEELINLTKTAIKILSPIITFVALLYRYRGELSQVIEQLMFH